MDAQSPLHLNCLGKTNSCKGWRLFRRDGIIPPSVGQRSAPSLGRLTTTFIRSGFDGRNCKPPSFRSQIWTTPRPSPYFLPLWFSHSSIQLQQVNFAHSLATVRAVISLFSFSSSSTCQDSARTLTPSALMEERRCAKLSDETVEGLMDMHPVGVSCLRFNLKW